MARLSVALAVLLVAFTVLVEAALDQRRSLHGLRGGQGPGAIDAMKGLSSGSSLESPLVIKTSGGAGAGDSTPSSSPAPTQLASSVKPKSLGEIMGVAWRRALGGGIPGAIAGAVQVILLMWLRTTTNYQYRYGTTMRQAMSTLYKQGGVGRFYEGVSFALLQGPLSRFGSTAANEGVLTLLSNLPMTRGLPLPFATAVASLAAGGWRIVLMPIDTCKVILQVEGNEGFRNLMKRVNAGEISVLYQGAAATWLATVVGHFPWFACYNWLNQLLEVPKGTLARLSRSAFIGFVASVVSDSVSNCIRVLKITKQASASFASLSYMQALQVVLAADGWKGLMGRGLMTRVIGNGIQSILFTVIWRWLQESSYFAVKDEAKSAAKKQVGHGDAQPAAVAAAAEAVPAGKSSAAEAANATGAA